MAGIYLHIPFCKTRCIYCDFYTGTDESALDAFVDAVRAEARGRSGEITEPVKTVYFGGGTPSRLHRQHFERIFEMLFETFSVEKDAEITLEANPDDLSPEYIRMLSRLPFNRMSIGIQSFDDHELAFLSRRHTAAQAIRAVQDSQQVGFGNISIDLMYGLPGQTTEIWEHTVNRACDLNVPHISAYHLMYEEKTKMHSLLQTGKIAPVNDETSIGMFTGLIDTLTDHGFIHYEISNFGQPGFFSRHNSSYWKGEKYLGLGPSAHSFDGNNRSWNVASLSGYLKGAGSGTPGRETEHLSNIQKYNESILTGLRTMWGVNLTDLEHRFGKTFRDYCLVNARKFLDEQLLTIENNMLRFTRKGIFISDGIMSDLMWVE